MERTQIVGILTAIFAIAFMFIYNAEYTKKDFDVCASTDNRIRVLYKLSLEKCVYECGRRPGCQRLNYKLARKECGLFNESYSRQSNEALKCTVVTREEIDPDKKRCQCKIGMACQKNGTCQYEECPPIPQMDPSRGVIKGNMQNIGAKVKVQCNEGYTRIPDIQPVVCGNDGQWGEIPDCLQCPPVPEMDPIRGVIKGNMQHIGAEVKVQCNRGFARVPIYETVVCGNNGHWGEFPECLKECNEKRAYLPYTTHVPVRGYIEGESFTYTCVDGMYINNQERSKNVTIACQLRGWDFSHLSSKLCVNETFYPKHPENLASLSSYLIEINTKMKAYKEAESECGPYGELLKIDTEKKQTKISEYLNETFKYSSSSYWIQGTFNGAAWMFNDGSEIIPQYWSRGRSFGTCLKLNALFNFDWNSERCETFHGYICEY